MKKALTKIWLVVSTIWLIISGKKIKEIWIEFNRLKEVERTTLALAGQISSEMSRLDYFRQKAVELINNYTAASNQMSPEAVREMVSGMDVERNKAIGRVMKKMVEGHINPQAIKDQISTIFAGVKSEQDLTIAKTIDDYFTNLVNRETIRSLIQEMVGEKQTPGLLDLERAVFNLSASHRNTPLLLAALRVNIPVWLYGDAGSGKTTAASLAAKTLGLDFRFISVCPTTTKSDLLGFIDAGGTYRTTAFREIFENGGLYLIDEIDNGNPSILSVLNAALANEYCAFPDGNIRRHPSTRFVAAANTIGKGASIRYVGRNAVDATTLDRFAFVRMDIDENLERELAGVKQFAPGQVVWSPVNLGEGGEVTKDEWHRLVVATRQACNKLGVEHLITPRATLYGCQLIKAGVGQKHLEDMLLWKGLREADCEKIRDNRQVNNQINKVISSLPDYSSEVISFKRG